ncbi:MAG: STAS domain-containing protein [Thermodesulforhabdaceae bacterium]
MCKVDVKKYQDDDSTLIVSLAGRFNRDVVRDIRDKVFKVLRSNRTVKSLAVDLSEVEWIDTAGVALLVLLCQHVRAKGGVFRVLYPSDRVKRVFKLAQLEEFLTVENGNRLF